MEIQGFRQTTALHFFKLNFNTFFSIFKFLLESDKHIKLLLSTLIYIKKN